jgi:hypothetical protein
MSTSALRAIQPNSAQPATGSAGAPAVRPAPAVHAVPKPAGVSARPAGPAVAKAAPAKAKSASGGINGDLVALVVSWLIPIGITVWGWSYYTHTRAVRLRHPLNELLRPSGPVGLSLGIAGLALFVFMWLYPFRKSIKWLAWTGPLGAWMRVHVISGLAIPVIVAVHAGYHFQGMIGLGYWAMFIVSLSGIVGRYLYVHIPRSRNGVEMTLEEVSGERRALLTQIAAATGLVPAEVERRLAIDPRPYEGLDPLRTLWRMFLDDLARHRMLRELQRELKRPSAKHAALKGHELHETMRLAKRELKLTQQVRMLEATRKIFGYWHVAHRPFAITALIAVLVHVAVAVFVGGVGLPMGH